MGTGRAIMFLLTLAVALSASTALRAAGQVDTAMQPPLKSAGAFYTNEVIGRAREIATAHEWAAHAQAKLIESARPWLEASDDELWGMMFGPHISRSWMVWSNGFCPTCKADVKMYTWDMEPWGHRWKVQCPHCKEWFPKNDFGAFQESGVDEHGVFQPDLADRSLLFNAEHPDPNDPLHLFGVDDGEGYVDEDGNRWRFIGAYLIYGQWKRLLVNGIVNLSAAYAATSEPAYAYKAALMLDRIADVFPEFDFAEQGIVYERKGDRGQVSTWHDACAEIHQLILAYDRVFEGARGQGDALAAFLSEKAKQHKLENPKASWIDIQRNIETRIFRDTLEHHNRILSNYPTTDVALLLIKTVLDWPQNREEVHSLLDGIIKKASAVDGVSGEKGMAGYTTIAPRTLSSLLAQFSLLDPDFLKTVYERHPILHQTYLFHVDMWCMDEWYPQSGDTGRFGMKGAVYMGVPLSRSVTVNPSLWTFLWDMYGLTQDPVFIQVLYNANGRSVDGMPYDLFGRDPVAFQTDVQAVIDDVGPIIKRESVNKEQWRLAILRKGEGDQRRALWLDYDSHGAHSHADGMNLGLFAKGLDLMPDFGYPPVGYGGWRAPKAQWYMATAAHNSVVVDGKDQNRTDGSMTLWVEGERLQAMRASSPQMYGIDRYERTAAMVDLGDGDFYILDCFFVVGGKEHRKFFHSYFGDVTTEGLTLEPADDFQHDMEMRNFRRHVHPDLGWSVDWRMQNYHDYLPEGKDVHVRYTDLTSKVEAYLAEGWVDVAGYGGAEEWIPRVMVRRSTEDEYLNSTFVSVIEPYENERTLKAIRRLPLESINTRVLPDPFVGACVERADGKKDVWLIVDGRGPAEMGEPEHDIYLRGQMALATFGADGLERLALCNAEHARVGDIAVMLGQGGCNIVELTFNDGQVTQVAGKTDEVEYVEIDRKEVPIHR